MTHVSLKIVDQQPWDERQEDRLHLSVSRAARQDRQGIIPTAHDLTAAWSTEHLTLNFNAGNGRQSVRVDHAGQAALRKALGLTTTPELDIPWLEHVVGPRC